jgi:dipeptidyl aminopeptidase/acylaminoacyl peptidase
VLTASEGNVWEGRYSPNGRWIAFVNSQRRSAPDRCAIGVVPAEGSVDRQWITVAPDRSCADKPRWNRDGTALYFLANEGAYLQVWRVPFDAEGGRPTGPAVRLSRFDSPGFKVSRSLSRIGWGLSDRKAYVTMTSTAGSIWMLDNVDK